MYEEKLEALQNELIRRGILSTSKLADIKAALTSQGGTFIEHLLSTGLIKGETLYKILADLLTVPFIDLKDFIIDTDTIKLIPANLARQYKLIPLFKIGHTLTVTMVDPTDIIALDRIKSVIRLDIDPCLSTEADINSILEQYYGVTSTVAFLMDDLVTSDKAEEKNIENIVQSSIDEDQLSEEPVIKLVNLLIKQAIREGASDIHIEPTEKALVIRFRVDGILHSVPAPPKKFESELIARIKVLANMDITETRLPQDGRFSFNDQNKQIDVRTASVPTVKGEHVVLRLLNTGNLNIGLNKLGFTPDMLLNYRRLIKRPFGMILVTGPTGSGKTTTLYSTLSEIISAEKNIVTIEDPVEYRLDGIRQIQINPKIGLTFTNGLRSIVRQDPDIIFVGEIRDTETAEIAIQSALTGHLVFSTLHTTDASGAVSRLVEMGIEPFLVASSLNGVLAQRLVRKVCLDCKETIKITAKDAQQLELKAGQTYLKGRGCKNCLSTGYKSRIGLFELLEINQQIHEAILNSSSSSEIKKIAINSGMTTLRQDGIRKITEKITTPEEVFKSTELLME
ncbi:GspE/PulE family protein [Chlamydiota bacterium]